MEANRRLRRRDSKRLRRYGVQLKVLQDDECMLLIKAFVRETPELWNEDIGV